MLLSLSLRSNHNCGRPAIDSGLGSQSLIQSRSINYENLTLHFSSKTATIRLRVLEPVISAVTANHTEPTKVFVMDYMTTKSRIRVMSFNDKTSAGLRFIIS